MRVKNGVARVKQLHFCVLRKYKKVKLKRIVYVYKEDKIVNLRTKYQS